VLLVERRGDRVQQFKLRRCVRLSRGDRPGAVDPDDEPTRTVDVEPLAVDPDGVKRAVLRLYAGDRMWMVDNVQTWNCDGLM
jgi:hypothetical protein